MTVPVLFASMFVVIPVLLCLGVAVFVVIAGQKQKFELALAQPGFATGEDVSGTVQLKASGDIAAESAVVRLVGVYEERRRKPRSTAGYDEADDEWESYAVEAFRHEEELAVDLPVAKGFKAEIPFAFPAPRPEMVTVRTKVGGVLQGLEIREGELPGSGFAMLTWTVEAEFVGSELEPLAQVVQITLQ